MSPAQDRALEVLHRVAEDRVISKAQTAVAERTHSWIFDPEHADVVGLVDDPDGCPIHAVVVVYLSEDDFEVDDSWLFDRSER